MFIKRTLNTVVASFGAAVLASAMMSASASANENPFAVDELSSGYQLAMEKGKCGEGKCGGSGEDKKKEGKCGEDRCGGDSDEDEAEGKCGEGKCGGSGEKKKAEGKCGEGKCGDGE